MKTFKEIIILSILLLTYIFINAYTYSNIISENISKNVFRLHIIANSDQEEDQKLKYAVRDSIIDYMNYLCQNSSSKEETISIISSHLNDFKNLADKIILKEGFSYHANVELGNFKFPTKSYHDITFPAGFYDALEIKIGKASGKNWWCVLYPSLCFINATDSVLTNESKLQLKNSMSEEEYKIISENNNHPTNIKFKLVEFFNKTKFIASKK